ncbi:MAG TPA: HNH endonuclease signature motif containing protein [Anaerolineae bacterium]|nr:HNH endonuclease signature motif containing protein [Anaerolineae bacterium]HQI84627.1 HNH endonuclease signature motif containing protein [Anaerolineae bacterium]
MPRPYISAEVDRRVREIARYRCGYCLSPQHLVMARLEIEHIVPLAQGGSNTEANLWLACPICNRYKGDKVTAPDPLTGARVSLFNPREQVWTEHFRWIDNGLRIEGLTPTGRATVQALHLSDDLDVVEVRSYRILAGWHPPED